MQNAKKLSTASHYEVREQAGTTVEKKCRVSRKFLWMNFNMNYLRMNTSFKRLFPVSGQYSFLYFIRDLSLYYINIRIQGRCGHF